MNLKSLNPFASMAASIGVSPLKLVEADTAPLGDIEHLKAELEHAQRVVHAANKALVIAEAEKEGKTAFHMFGQIKLPGGRVRWHNLYGMGADPTGIIRDMDAIYNEAVNTHGYIRTQSVLTNLMTKERRSIEY